MAVSDTPWSKFSAADYSVEQWHRACICHNHDGPPTSKDQCKLPVREPDGTLNRAGVHAAAAVLGGARGGIKISVSERIAATKMLAGYYKQLGEKPPTPKTSNSKAPAFLKYDDVSPSSHNKLAIVALPRQTDLAWAVGTEEKHATILFLGEDVSSDVTSLVEASVQELIRITNIRPFTETISSVASLGDGGARVWMIDSNAGLRSVRDSLLRMPSIRALYDIIEQHPNYTPHVTIGFPREGQTFLSDFEETQARIVKRVTFDRIALWRGENHDLVWRLPENTDDEAVAHAENMMHNFFEHHGIKGQRWGIRRRRGSDGTVEGGTKDESSDTSSGGGHGGEGSGKDHVSVDAQRFVKTQGKKQHQLSDREIKEANARAEAIKKYNEFFGPKPNAELALKVERLALEKRFKDLNAELHPSALARIQRLIKFSSPAFKAVLKAATSDAAKKNTKTLTDILKDAFEDGKTSKTRTRRPKGAPTSHATRVTAEHVGTHRNPVPVHNITSLDSAASPLALPRRS